MAYIHILPVCLIHYQFATFYDSFEEFWIWVLYPLAAWARRLATLSVALRYVNTLCNVVVTPLFMALHVSIEEIGSCEILEVKINGHDRGSRKDLQTTTRGTFDILGCRIPHLIQLFH